MTKIENLKRGRLGIYTLYTFHHYFEFFIYLNWFKFWSKRNNPSHIGLCAEKKNEIDFKGMVSFVIGHISDHLSSSKGLFDIFATLNSVLRLWRICGLPDNFTQNSEND